jgi:hypothetical protein
MTSDLRVPGPTAPLELLRRTRALTATTAALLAVQLYGNLYEQLVGNVATLAAPRPGALVGALAPGSPVYYYLPWVPLGVVLVVVLARRLPRLGAPPWVVRRLRRAVVAVGVAVAVKAALITRVNPLFRDPTVDAASLRGWAVTWAIGNGVAILAVATALVLLLSWRARLLDATRDGRGAAVRA